MLPENTVDTPYMSPMSATPTSATEGASSFGRVSFAMSPSMTAPKHEAGGREHREHRHEHDAS